MKKFLDFMDNVEERILTIILPVMVIVVFMATFFRFTKLAIIPWSEELVRYLMIWLIFLGVGAGAKNNKHFTVDNLVNKMPKSTHKALFILRTAIIIGFCFVIIILSFSLIGRLQSMGQLSPSLRIPIWIIYASIPIGSTLMIIRSTQYLIRNILKENRE
ncbi:TRAP transporter small permease [Tissierella sp. Yu-01]|uniref:TRAP transporter small permease n=1 Tax=Tissierella sp. Yu-01 TaxID=3035694 RepID=UPI00240DBA24|nr:TRAP transporter small permease [Tissierella sp. Yu-01]WFA08653.1 TRAP transporter small permease [Tissierella sp. Yu-01]